ncbi:MAG: VOC family protein [Brevundimonas sp.]|uniref:VOC family protein n=1 Tax=Brevundimonas sp. TaxID=1871086 RepID=UPI0027328006|nr:VOC family protein [Brevundimonas sp.]MDP3403074.1 VOC family protein [Brevundimonas sp.]
MDNQLGYFTLDTVDIARAKAFYGGLFGWTFEDQGETYTHVAGSNPACGFTKAERAAGHSNLYFRVEDVDAAVARVTELGGRAAVPADSASGRSATVCDDQGVSFSLWQPGQGY